MVEDKSQFIYKIKEESADPTASQIEKSGLTAVFSLAQISRNRSEYEGYAKQWKAQLDLEEKKMENVLHHHPFVKDLTDEQISVVHFYQTCKGLAEMLKPKIKEMEENVEDLDAEVAEINKQVGIAVPLSSVLPENNEEPDA